MEDIPITSGYRYSALGYTDIPEVAAFSKDPLFEIFSNKKQTESKDFNSDSDVKFLGLWLTT